MNALFCLPSPSPSASQLTHTNFSHSQQRLAVAFAVLGFCSAAANIAPAQTAHYSGATPVFLGGTMTTLGHGFGNPSSTAVDRNGNVFVTDIASHSVKEILAVGGTIPASPTIRILSSSFISPGTVAVDGLGDLYVTDGGNDNVDQILAVDGSIPDSPSIVTLTTVANPQAVAVDASGDVYISGGCMGTYPPGMNCGFVEEAVAVNGVVSPNGNWIGLPLTPNNPGGLAVDASGNVYVSDWGNNQVVEVLAVNGSVSQNSQTRILFQLPGSGGPAGLAVDASGNLFVSNSAANIVYEAPATGGVVGSSLTPFCSAFNLPSGIAVDNNGNLDVADVLNNRVVQIPIAGANCATTNIGTTTPSVPLTFTFYTAGTLGATAVLTKGATGLDFADAGNGSCVANAAFAAGQTCTINVTFAPKFSGPRSGAAVLENTSGTIIATAYLQGIGLGPQVNFLPATQTTLGSGLSQPFGVAVDGYGNIFVADFSQGLREIVAADGSVRPIAGAGTSPAGVAIDDSGNLFVADFNANIVYEIPAANGYTGTILLGGGFKNPSGVAVDTAGNVFVADYGNNAVKEIPQGCSQAGCVVTLGSGFSGPLYLAVDGNENVFVSDDQTAVKEIRAAGNYTTVQTLFSSIGYFTGLALDNQGNIFFVDTNGSKITELLKSSNYSTGNTVAGSFNSPYGLAIDPAGNIYVADDGNSRVVRLDFFDPPSLTFATTAPGSTSADSPQTVTVANVGNAPLTLPIPTIGSNPSVPTGFTLNSSSSACPVLNVNSYQAATLAAGASCQLPISFTPATASAFTGSLLLTDNNLNANYATQAVALAGSAIQAVPAPITWTAPAPITYGTALDQAQLNATSTVAGTFSYSPAAGTILTAGSNVLTVTFTPTDTTDYTTATSTVVLTVNQASPDLSWPAPLAIFYGTALSATQLDASSTVAGTFSYSPAAGSVVPVGAQTLTVTFTPADTTDYTTATSSVLLVVHIGHPVITWAPPAPVPYGTALGATQLNASSNVPGTFAYSPAAGTVLPAGSHPLAVTFTPTDTTDYTRVSSTVTLTVTQASPTLTWAAPAPVTYGTALSATQLNASSSVPGTFAYSPAAGTVLAAGTHTLTVTFTPTATTNYTTATSSVTLTVNQASPTVTWAAPAPVTSGTALSATQLNASSNVPGTFSYSPAAGTVLTAGAHTLTVTFTPTDTTDYTPATSTVTLTVNQASPSLIWAAPAPITYGSALSATQLNATSPVAGTFSYSPAAGTTLSAGAHTLTVTFTPTDTTDYTTATSSVALTVSQASPTLTWAAPPSITYGAALSATQLNASSTVAGTFSYSPAAGTVLTAGTHTLTVTFTPTDTTDYTSATASVPLTVNKATPLLTWPSPAPVNYGTALSATQLDASASVPGTFVYTPAAGTVAAAGTDALSVTFTPTDAADYNSATASVSLVVNKPGFTLSASPASLSIKQNSSATSTISVTDAGGFSGSVRLAASGLSSGVTATFANNPTTSSTVLTLKASQKATLGTATITITGTSGSITATTTISLTVVAH